MKEKTQTAPINNKNFDFLCLIQYISVGARRYNWVSIPKYQLCGIHWKCFWIQIIKYEFSHHLTYSIVFRHKITNKKNGVPKRVLAVRVEDPQCVECERTIN